MKIISTERTLRTLTVTSNSNSNAKRLLMYIFHIWFDDLVQWNLCFSKMKKENARIFRFPDSMLLIWFRCQCAFDSKIQTRSEHMAFFSSNFQAKQKCRFHFIRHWSFVVFCACIWFMGWMTANKKTNQWENGLIEHSQNHSKLQLNQQLNYYGIWNVPFHVWHCFFVFWLNFC